MSSLLFVDDRVDEVSDWTDAVDHLGRRSILWIDLERRDREELVRLQDHLDLDQDTVSRLGTGDGRPYFGDFGDYLHITAFAPTDGAESDAVRIDCIVSKQWVLTLAETKLEVIEDFRERVTSSSGAIGRLDGLEFLGDLLAWVLEAYLAAFERIELALEEFDERVMRGEQEDAEDELEILIAHRKEIGRLRRALVSHRGTFLALARPELEAIMSTQHAEHFQNLRAQLEDVVQVARDGREAVFGSFDVLIARTERRTNEIMKLLTLGTFLFLPGALLAGVMGMNFQVGLFETAWYFWIVCAVIAIFAVGTFAFARLRRWV